MVGFHGVDFAINESACCVWDADPYARNAEFIEGLRPEFFTYLADIHTADLAGPRRQLASMALGAAYGQGLETLFAVLFASLQAPDCVVGWLPKYRQGDLNELVAAIGHRLVLTKVPLHAVTWDGIVDVFHSPFQSFNRDAEPAIKKVVARLWQRLAADFLDPIRCDQYNTIKHGFRSQPGGVRVQIGNPVSVGNPPNIAKSFDLGGSEFGSSFVTLEALKPFQFRIQRKALNWDPEILADRLRLITFSINNIIAFLRNYNQIAVQVSNKFEWPPVSQIEHALRSAQGISSLTFPTYKPESDDVAPLTKKEILKVYDRPAPQPYTTPMAHPSVQHGEMTEQTKAD